MKTQLGLRAVIKFKNGLYIDNGSIRFDPCDSPRQIGLGIGILIESILKDGIQDRAVEDLSWLLMSTTDWKPADPEIFNTCRSDGKDLDEMDRYVLTLCNELRRHPPLSHESVESITVFHDKSWAGRQGGGCIVLGNYAGEVSGEWLRRAVIDGLGSWAA